MTQSAHDLYPSKNTEASAGSAKCQDLPNTPDQNSLDNKGNNQLSSECDKTVAYQTSLVKAISSVTGNIESLKKLDRMRVAWKKDQQNKSKEQEFRNELARTITIVLKEHTKMKESYSTWERKFYLKYSRESTIDDLKKDIVAYGVYKKMKKADSLLQICHVSL